MTPLLPVLRTATATEAVAHARLLADAGLRSIELTATTRDWQRALEELRSLDVLLGVGTIVDSETATMALDLGADFLVSPRLAPDVRVVASERGVPFIEGGLTPTELAVALEGGVAKLFPAHLGGPDYLRSLLAVVPGARIVPTGGIGLDQIDAWLDAGAVAVGVGSALVARLADDPNAAAEWVKP